MQNSGRGPGRFSDTYAPERRCIPFERWPEADRQAADRARSSGDIFDFPGPAGSWAPSTWQARRKAYGRFLSYLDRTQQLLATQGPGERPTPDRVRGYVGEARACLSANTLNQSLRELRLMLQAMLPDQDWSWMRTVPGYPTGAEVRGGKKPKSTFDAKLLCGRAFDLMDAINEEPASQERRILFRNALIVTFQCVFSLRRRNLFEMRLGRNLIVGENVTRLVFSAEETKTGHPIGFMVPHFLKSYLLAYLAEHRPALLQGATTEAVWANRRAGELGYGAAPTLFAAIGKRLLGYPIVCHDFRHAVATSMLTRDPRKIRVASGQLTHGSVSVVNKYYDHSGDAGSRHIWEKALRDIITGKMLDER